MFWAVSIASLCVLILSITLAAVAYQSWRLRQMEDAIASAWGTALDPPLEPKDDLGTFEFPIANHETSNARRAVDLVARVAQDVAPPPRLALVGSVGEPRLGSVFTQGSLLIVAFRGTQTKQEVEQDFRLDQVMLDESYVHAGFSEIYQRVKPELFKLIDSGGFSEVIITGHSLGGGLSLLLAYDLFSHGVPITVYTFGSPKAGNRTFMEDFRRNHKVSVLRFTNTADVICELPLSTMPNFKDPSGSLIKYTHVGKVREFYEDLGSWRANHTLAVYARNLE